MCHRHKAEEDLGVESQRYGRRVNRPTRSRIDADGAQEGGTSLAQGVVVWGITGLAGDANIERDPGQDLVPGQFLKEGQHKVDLVA